MKRMSWNNDECPLTGLPIEKLSESGHDFHYELKLPNRSFRLRINTRYVFDFPVDEIKPIIVSLLLNDKLRPGNKLIIWDENATGEDERNTLNLAKFLEQAVYPRTHREKLEFIFNAMFKAQTYNGAYIDYPTFFSQNKNKFYLKDEDEFFFYYESLLDQGLLKAFDHRPGAAPSAFKISYSGFDYAMKLLDEGLSSNNCFVAMSFRPGMEAARQAIKEALVETGFTPIIIDERNIESDHTINDEIIANLRKCRFCIADFTNQSKGVYFESGYALGQGKKVIYTCEKADFNENAHFDIRPLQHILWEKPEQLKKDLINKIEAWIK